MNKTPELKPVTASVDPSFMDKVDRIFDASPRTVFDELLQNSRRAGATSVDVELRDSDVGTVVTFRDNGRGMETPDILLRLSGRGWDDTTQDTEDPAGMGFFCLSNFDSVEVRSQSWSAIFTPRIFRGQQALVPALSEAYEGTRIRWVWAGKSVHVLCAELRGGAKYCKLESVNISFGNRTNPVHITPKEFLEGAINSTQYEGLGASVATRASGRDFYDGVYVNFNGLQLVLPSPAIVGWRGLSCAVLVDVYNANHLHLVLPARNAIKHNAALDRLLEYVEVAVYRHIASTLMGDHPLPYATHAKAMSMGVDIGEARARLMVYSVSDGGPYVVSGADDLKKCVLAGIVGQFTQSVDTIMARAHNTLGDAHVLRPATDFVGYSWYDAIPEMRDIRVTIDGVTKSRDDFFVDRDCSDDDRFSKVGSILVEFVIQPPGDAPERVITYSPSSIVASGSTSDIWEDSDAKLYLSDEFDHDSGDAAGALTAAAFDACDDSEADASDVQESNFYDAAASSYLEFIGTPLDGAKYELSQALHRDKLPYSATRGAYEWTVECVNGAPRITRFVEANVGGGSE